MPYDTELRRDTLLARKLIARIGATGPISVDAYMDACLNDPEFGYYRRRVAIGRAGDFITAPEISQVFGELIGLWCAVVWQQMGSPQRFNLIELGAGRGTLLADALRAGRVVPGFCDAAAVHIVDQNPVLIALQRTALAPSGATVTWHETLDTLPNDAPSIWLANEFLDTLPVRQWQRSQARWLPRAIGLRSSGELTFVETPKDWLGFRSDVELPTQLVDTLMWADGDVYENQPRISQTLDALADKGRTAPFAALFIDYGYSNTARVDTLQAVRAHQSEHVLTSPGEADLSCLVDFDHLAYLAGLITAKRQQIAVDGPVTQSEFLGQLGVMERASRLMAQNPALANTLETGVARLMAPQGMGTRFMAIGIRAEGLPPLPGLSLIRAG